MRDLSYLKGLDFSTMGVGELLAELDKLWLLEPQFPGECPTCDTIHGQLIVAFGEMPDDELLALVSPMNKAQLNQIAYPLETIAGDLENPREWLNAYVMY